MRDVSSLRFFGAPTPGFAIAAACFRGAFTAAVALVALGACGSDEGGGAEDGKCSPPGATQPCTGPAACPGGQVCGTDGSWGACDCGGGTGGTGGAGTGGMAGSTGGTAAIDGGAGSDGAAGASGSAGTDGGSQWQDEPCPSTTPIVNCSTSCGGPTDTCRTCGEFFYKIETKYPQFPYIVRTPSKPGVDPKCAVGCTQPGATYGMGIDLVVPFNDALTLKVTVPKPWYVQFPGYGSPNDYCLDYSYAKQGCALFGENARPIALLTDDPYAPSVNAIIENVPDPGSCP